MQNRNQLDLRAGLSLSGESWVHIYAGLADIEAAREVGTIAVMAARRHALVVECNLPRRRTTDASTAIGSGLDCIGVSVTTRGHLTGSTGSRDVSFGPGEVRAFDYLAPRDWHAATDEAVDEITLVAHRGRFTPHLTGGKNLDWWTTSETAAAAAIGASLAALADRIGSLTPGELDAIGGGIVEMAIATFGSASPPRS